MVQILKNRLMSALYDKNVPICAGNCFPEAHVAFHE